MIEIYLAITAIILIIQSFEIRKLRNRINELDEHSCEMSREIARGFSLIVEFFKAAAQEGE